MPERVTLPIPTKDPFVDELEVRVIQSLCKKVGRTEEDRLHAFVMGLATARLIYLLREGIDAEITNPIPFIAQVKGRLATVSVNVRALVIQQPLDDPVATREAINVILNTTDD